MHWLANICLQTTVTIMCPNNELIWLFTNRFSATVLQCYMKVKRMGGSFWQKDSLINQKNFELWLIMIFSPVANFAQQALRQKALNLLVINHLNSSLRHIIFTNITLKPQNSLIAPSTGHEKWADWTDHVCLMINCKKGASGYTVNLLIYCE